MHEHRFKIAITYYGSEIAPFSLYQAVGRSFWSKTTIWAHLASFKTQEEARAYYERVKELPEYLR